MRKRTIVLLQCSTALGAMGYGVMFTVLDNFRDEYGISEANLGILVGVGFFTSFFAQILIAPLADKGKAKQMIMIGMSLEIVGNLLMAFGHNFEVLFVARLLMGFGGGITYPAVRRVIILADKDNMGSNLGRLVSADVGGFALGPLLSAITADLFGIAAPFLIISVLVSIVIIGLWNLHVTEADIGTAPTQKLAFDLLRIKPIAGAITIGLSLYLMIGAFDSVWSLMMADLDAAPWVANVGITLFALPMVVLGPRGGRLTHKIGPFRASIGGLTLGALCMVAYGLLGSPYVMLGVGIFHGIIDGLTITGGSAAIALVAPKDRLASAQGLMGGMQTLMGGFAAITAGATYDAFGRTPTYLFTALLMLLLIATGSWLARASLHINGLAETSE